MAFTSSLPAGALVIDDGTAEHVFAPPPNKTRGLVLRRPFGAARAYEGVAQPFPKELLIPRSEWQARIQEREERKARAYDLIVRAGLPCKDQNGTNYCHTEDTEVLTDRGWTRWPDYNWSDLLGTVDPVSGRMEFQQPLQRHVYDHDGPMLYSTNGSVDFGVTLDHRMLVRKWDERRRKLSDRYTFQRAGDVGWYFGLPPAPSGHAGTELRQVEVPGDRAYAGDDFIALLALIVSDGYAGGTENTRNWVSFACFSEARRPEVRELAARIGFHELPSRAGVWIRYDAGALAEWLRANAYVSRELGSHNKRVPELVKCASGRQIRHFLRLYGDQSHNLVESGHYFSTSRRAIDDLQELCLRVGKRGSIWEEERSGKEAFLEDGQRITSRKTMYHLHVRATDELSICRKKHLEREHYRGPVYCATVPNGTLITRRNGTVLISGNCWANGPTHVFEVKRLLQNEPVVILSPASVAAQITGGRNVGGWGRDALEWIAEHGIVPVDSWPANSRDLRLATDENKQKALEYRADVWFELEPGNLDEQVSCLLQDLPYSPGFNWWGHQVSAFDAVWLDGAVAILHRNSWGMDWPQAGAGGWTILQGRRALADDAVAVVTARASAPPRRLAA